MSAFHLKNDVSRQSRAKLVLDALLSWAERSKAPPKFALGRAVCYLKEQWPYLIRYLEDGRLEVSNNRAKRSIKPFCNGPEELPLC